MEADQRDAWESAAIALIQAGNLRGGEQRLKDILAVDPSDARALALMAHCRLVEDDDREALKIARSAAASDPSDLMVRRVLVNALLANGKHKEADEVAFDLAADDPQDSSALFRLAIARHNTKDYIGARELFDRAEQYAGDDVHALLDVARLRLHEWNYASASELARRAMSIDPNEADAFRILGECALATRQPAEAYDLALEALRLAPGDRDVQRLLMRARSRGSALLRPFLPGVDWMLEMDRRGLVILPILMGVLGLAALVSILYDLGRVAAGLVPAVILSVGLTGLFAYALACYGVALAARWRIRRDVRRIQLPDF